MNCITKIKFANAFDILEADRDGESAPRVGLLWEWKRLNVCCC